MSGDPAGERRILILGVAGVGKSTLAVALATRLGAPVYHLDNVADRHGMPDVTLPHAPPGEFPDHPFAPRALAERRAIEAQLAAAPCWVAEGTFLDWTTGLRARADTIVWLDHLGPIAAMRSVLGRARRSYARGSDGEGTPAGHEAPGGLEPPAGQPSTARRARFRAYLHHGIELLRELWDVAGYFWWRSSPGVERDIADGRWDRLCRAGIRRSLAPDEGRLIHVRHRGELRGLEDRIVAGHPAADAVQPSASR
ncbi:MAG: hypothetical protein A2V85_11170 [Chloroflexi bacterium RBG_16_72_14]|nr:MAG: hypothetical protein A2V85_11170 [Chloroflexi bacterium RBG_16_72_14]